MSYIPGQPFTAVATFQQVNAAGVVQPAYNPYEVIFTVSADKATPPVATTTFKVGVSPAATVVGTNYYLAFTPLQDADWYVTADAYDIAGNHLGAASAMQTVYPRPAGIPAP